LEDWLLDLLLGIGNAAPLLLFLLEHK